MADFRRVYCTFCRQAFLTVSSDRCSLCCKRGGLLEEGSPAALQALRESKEPAPSPSPMRARALAAKLSAPVRPARREPASFSVPPQVAELAQELGAPLDRFASNAFHVWVYFGCGAILIALGVLIFLSFLSALSGGVGVVRPILGCTFLVGGASLVLRGRALLGGRLFAFEGGLVQVVGDAWEAMSWQDVAVVRRGKPPGDEGFTVTTPRRLSLRDHAGREWVFNEALSGFERFRDLVEEMTLPSLLAPALEDLQAGQTLSFGDAGVKSAGLSYPQKLLLDWASVAQAGIAQGHVVVLAKGLDEPYFAVPLFATPNAHVLLGLIEHFRLPSA